MTLTEALNSLNADDVKGAKLEGERSAWQRMFKWEQRQRNRHLSIEPTDMPPWRLNKLKLFNPFGDKNISPLALAYEIVVDVFAEEVWEHSRSGQEMKDVIERAKNAANDNSQIP